MRLLLREKPIPPPAKTEDLKLLTEFAKHLTTMSTGALLILIAFLEKVFVTPKWRLFAVLALLNFGLAIVLSARAYSGLSRFHLRKDYKRRLKWEWEAILKLRKTAWAMFSFGIFSLLIFAIRNLF